MDFSNYIEIKKDYEMLQENQPNVAYSIMVRASSELEYLGEELTALQEEMDISKAEYESFKDYKCLEYAKEMAVNKAEKYASNDDDVKAERNKYFSAKQILAKYQNMINFLTRIYYDCKAVWEKGNRNYRENRNGF
jgi:hypothetical protein